MNGKRNPYPSFKTVFLIVIMALVLNASLKYIGGLGKNNSAEKTISDYADANGFNLSDYPDEIVNLLKINDETKEFVLNYPSKIVDFKPDLLNFTEYENCTEPPLFMQWDLRWGYMSYNDSVMGISGSAPTTLSMAAIYELQDISLTPVYIAGVAADNDYEDKPEKLLSEGARALEMNVTEIPKNDSRLRQAVSESGSVVVCLTDGKVFSQTIVIRGLNEDGKYLMNDTMSKGRSEKNYTFADIGPHLKKIWKYSQ